MSEEVVIVDEVEAGTFFVLSLGSTVALLDEDNARGLRDDLNAFLGPDKQPQMPQYSGIEFPAGCDEPDLPVGTQIIDNAGDIATRVEGGWQWTRLDGNDVRYPSFMHSWDEICDSPDHRWFRVVA